MVQPLRAPLLSLFLLHSSFMRKKERLQKNCQRYAFLWSCHLVIRCDLSFFYKLCLRERVRSYNGSFNGTLFHCDEQPHKNNNPSKRVNGLEAVVKDPVLITKTFWLPATWLHCSLNGPRTQVGAVNLKLFVKSKFFVVLFMTKYNDMVRTTGLLTPPPLLVKEASNYFRIVGGGPLLFY